MNDINLKQIEIDETSKTSHFFSIIESLLFVSGEPMEIKQIASIIECKLENTKEILKDMSYNYEKSDRGIKLIKNKDLYQLATKAENSVYIQKMLGTNNRQSLSQAALEIVAIIAYKQPITRVEIDEIRGVKSDRAIATLMEKEIIKECGRMDIAGRPILYGTTESFLRYFGIENIDDMPGVEDLLLKYE